MSDVDLFFSKLNQFEQKSINNEILQEIAPLIRNIVSDFQLREEFYFVFRALNDWDKKARIVDAFNYVEAQIERLEAGIIDETDFSKLIADKGGLSLVVGAALAIFTGVFTFGLATLLLGAAGIAAFALYNYFEGQSRCREVRESLTLVKSFTTRLNSY